MDSRPVAPPANRYWVLPGRLLAGEYPGGAEWGTARERIGELLAAGLDCFVDLTAEEELPPYASLLPPDISHHRRPIGDHGVPGEPEHMRETLEVIESALAAGRRVYVHCRAGIGRTGTVVGCWLVERGLSGEQALEALNRAWQQSPRARTWPSVPETQAQVEYVRGWMPRIVPPPPDRLVTRYLGALVGLAAGDALAVATEGREPGSFAAVTGLAGGGTFDLPAGAWSDDTAMALCLAESLLACGGFDARDQIARYLRWRQDGYLSATGRCAGITESAAHALAVAQWRRQVFPGSHEPKQLDPEPLSRVAPVVLFAFGSPGEAVRLAGDAARTTCQSPTVVETCRLFAAMLHAALRGLPKDEVLAPRDGFGDLESPALRPRIRSLLRGRYRRKAPGQMRAGETVVQALEAALWAFDRTSAFRDGVLLAVNLGQRSDVAAAVFGQLGGAYYGIEAIPVEWRRGLARLGLIEGFAEQLWRAGGGRLTAG